MSEQIYLLAAQNSAICGLLLALGFGGVIAFLVAFYLLKRFRCTAEVSAVVTQIHQRVRTESDGDKSLVYAPEYTYEYNGQQYTVSSKTFMSDKTYEPGTAVRLLVDPSQPDYFLDPKRERSHLIPVCVLLSVFVVVGIVMAAGGR